MPLAKLEELRQERLNTLAAAIVKLQVQVAETIARIHQLDGAISALEQLQQSEQQPKD